MVKLFIILGKSYRQLGSSGDAYYMKINITENRCGYIVSIYANYAG